MKRLIAGFFAVAMVLTLVGSVSAPANAQTMTSAEIMAAIANLQAQLSSMTGGTVTGAQAQAMFNTDLTMGSKNSDVSSRQFSSVMDILSQLEQLDTSVHRHDLL